MKPQDPIHPDKETPLAEYASKDKAVVLRPHSHDGIREYDQLMPNWWLAIFFGSIAFFFGYWALYYNFGFFQTDHAIITRQVQVIEKAKATELENMLAQLNDSALVNRWATDPAMVAAGKQTFLTNCVACHGENLSARLDAGGGQFVPLPGLPLNDGQWKYGSKPMDIFRLINGGTPSDSAGNNGARMAAWGQIFPPMQIAQLTAFLIHENPKDFPKGE